MIAVLDYSSIILKNRSIQITKLVDGPIEDQPWRAPSVCPVNKSLFLTVFHTQPLAVEILNKSNMQMKHRVTTTPGPSLTKRHPRSRHQPEHLPEPSSVLKKNHIPDNSFVNLQQLLIFPHPASSNPAENEMELKRVFVGH